MAAARAPRCDHLTALTKERKHMTTVAFIGLGIMGKPMAINLINAGLDVVGYNRSQPAIDALVAAGGRGAASIGEAVKDADVVATMVPDSSDVEEVLSGPDGVFAAARESALVVDFSSIRPDVSVRLATAGKQRGLRVLDAPV
ncbi:MAG: 2-hydroxy-3-oxopropionate reductase, partial [Mycobacterium sp.]|nr:2-hydroxy-3-oxopropionate reductase [Mycobacterium sp.]